MTADDLAALKTQLVQHEGLKLKVYVDTVGIPTIGVGRNLRDSGISPDEAELMLDNDIAARMGALSVKLPWFPRLDAVRQRVLIDLAFMGVETLMGFHRMLAAMRISDWETAAAELLDSEYALQVGARADRLARWLRTGKVD